jgi:hypothetical protein
MLFPTSPYKIVTPSFKVKTECIPLCVSGYNQCLLQHILIQRLLQDQEVYTVEQTPHTADRGLAHLEEVFIKEFFIF